MLNRLLSRKSGPVRRTRWRCWPRLWRGAGSGVRAAARRARRPPRRVSWQRTSSCRGSMPGFRRRWRPRRRRSRSGRGGRASVSARIVALPAEPTVLSRAAEAGRCRHNGQRVVGSWMPASGNRCRSGGADAAEQTRYDAARNCTRASVSLSSAGRRGKEKLAPSLVDSAYVKGASSSADSHPPSAGGRWVDAAARRGAERRAVCFGADIHPPEWGTRRRVTPRMVESADSPARAQGRGRRGTTPVTRRRGAAAGRGGHRDRVDGEAAEYWTPFGSTGALRW